MSYENWSARGRTPGDSEAEVRDALEASRARTRQDAAIALVDAAETGLDGETVSALEERALADDDPEVRQFAVEALGIAGSASGSIRQAIDDSEPWVRAEAVVALSRASENAGPLWAALDDDSGWVRRNAVIALGKRGAIEQSTLVEHIKGDPHPAVREYAAQFLGAVVEDVSEAERILAAMLAREPNAFARAKAAESLGDLGTDRAEEALEAHGVTDQSEDVARTAKRALASARGTDPDDLDIEIEPPSAPGGGPDTPAEQSVDGFDPARSFGSRSANGSPAPGGAPGFDPRDDLNTDPQDRS